MTRKRHWRVISIVCAVTVVVIAVSACSRETEDWRSAQAADTAAAYEQFLHEHPDSEHATGATARVAQLAEEEDWQRAAAEDSLQAYQQFLEHHPQGKWSQEAHIRIENFALAEPTAPAVDSPAAAMADLAAESKAAAVPKAAVTPPQPASKAPVVKAAPPAAKTATPAATPTAGKSAGAQLGAFSTVAAAETHWKQVSGRYPKELGQLKHRVVTGKAAAGTVHRLQVPTGSEAAARELCARIKAGGQACIVY